MKIAVIGGTSLIGAQVVDDLRARGHCVVVAAATTAIGPTSGGGLREALAGARVVVDVADWALFEDAAVVDLVQTAGRNMLEAEATAGVRHHVALTIVGDERATDSRYMRAKVAQEQLIEAAGVPYTIVRTTQVFEFLRLVADAATGGQIVRVPIAALQPVAAADVAAAVADAALADPVNGIVEVAGPTRMSFAEFVREALASDGDPRTVVGDEHVRYFDTELSDASITPDPDARLGRTTFTRWLAAKGR